MYVLTKIDFNKHQWSLEKLGGIIISTLKPAVFDHKIYKVSEN